MIKGRAGLAVLVGGLLLVLTVSAGSAQDSIWTMYQQMGEHLLADREFDKAERVLLEAKGEAERFKQPDARLLRTLKSLSLALEGAGKLNELPAVKRKIQELQGQLNDSAGQDGLAGAGAQSGDRQQAGEPDSQRQAVQPVTRGAEETAGPLPGHEPLSVYDSEPATPASIAPHDVRKSPGTASGGGTGPGSLASEVGKPLPDGERRAVEVAAAPPPSFLSQPIDRKAMEIRQLFGHINWVRSIVFSADGRQALSGSEDKTARLWDLGSGAELSRLVGHEEKVNCVAMTADGSRALTASDDRTVRLWDPAAGKELLKLSGHENLVTCVAIAPDGSIGVSGGFDGTVRVWDLNDGQLLHVLNGHTGPVRCLTLSADGKLALSGSSDRTLRLWDIGEGKQLRQYQGHSEPILCVAISQNGKLAATGSADLTIRLWDLESGDEKRQLRGHSDWVLSVSFLEGGKRLISGSLDKTITLWDLDSGVQTARFTGLTNGVWGVCFAPDGQRALSGSDDKSIRLWNLDR